MRAGKAAAISSACLAAASAVLVVVVALVTWQALRGQSIVHPDALTLLVFAAIALAVGIPSAVVLARKARELHGIGQVTR